MGKIIGEELKDYVIQQINVRQKIHGSGQNDVPRTDQELVALNSNTSWIKLASGVSLSQEKLKELGFTSTDIEKYIGIGLAQNYILQGAVSKLVQSNNPQNNATNSNLEDAIPSEGTAGNLAITKDLETINISAKRSTSPKILTAPLHENNYQITEDQGIIPMPGIISADIKHLNRGSLKKAILKLKVQDRTQLSIIDALYLRLGYTVLLEWGNSIFIDNQNKIQNTTFSLLEKNQGFFSSLDKNFKNILEEIEEFRVRYNGNYDGMLAKISNFSWSFNTDGTYDVELTLLSWGDIIESLKSNVTAKNNVLNYLEAAPPEFIETKVYTLRKQNALLSYFHILKDISDPTNKGVGTSITLDGTSAGYLITSGSDTISNTTYKATYSAKWELNHHSYDPYKLNIVRQVKVGEVLNWEYDINQYLIGDKGNKSDPKIQSKLPLINGYPLYKLYKEEYDQNKNYGSTAKVVLFEDSKKFDTYIAGPKKGEEYIGESLFDLVRSNILQEKKFTFKEMFIPPVVKGTQLPAEQQYNPNPSRPTLNSTYFLFPQTKNWDPKINSNFDEKIMKVMSTEDVLGINEKKYNGIYWKNYVDSTVADWQFGITDPWVLDKNGNDGGKEKSTHRINFLLSVPQNVYGFKAIDENSNAHIYGGFQKNWGTNGGNKWKDADLEDNNIQTTNVSLQSITDKDDKGVLAAIAAEEASLTSGTPKPKCAEAPVYDDSGAQTGGGYEFFQHFVSPTDQPTIEKPFVLKFSSKQTNGTPGYKGKITAVSTAKVENPLKGYEKFDTMGVFRLESDPIQYYIKFGFLLQLIKDKVLPQIINEGNNVSPLFDIELDKQEMLCLNSNHTCQISYDPRVCIVRRDNFTKHWHDSDSNKANYKKSQKVFPELSPWAEEDDPNSLKRPAIANSMNIYLNFECVANAMESTSDDKGNTSVFPFLNSLCKSINQALGGVNNLEPVIDESTNTLHIIDSSPKYNYTDTAASIGTRNTPYELQLYAYTPAINVVDSNLYTKYYPISSNSSTIIYESTFARKVNLKTAITPGYATMISIGATAGGYAKGVEATSFAKWNEGIFDTYKTEYTPPEVISGSSSGTTSETTIQDTLQSYQTAMSDDIVCFGFKKLE